MEHFRNSSIKSHDTFHSKIYIFSDSALVTSANLTKTAFESNVEAGVLLDGLQVSEVKSFFEKSLWDKAKTQNVLKTLRITRGFGTKGERANPTVI